MQYVLKQGASEWLGRPEEPLEGFSWRCGAERDTTGILMWSDLFLTELASGEKVSTLLLFHIFYNKLTKKFNRWYEM